MADKDLTVHLKADDKITPAAKKAAKSLDQIPDRVETTVDVEAPGLDNLMGKLGELPGMLGSLGAAGGVAGLATGLFAAANAAKDLALEAQTTADLTGATVEETSKLQNVWKQSGADVNDLNDVLLQMNGALAQSPELAKSLGINLNDGKNISQRFVEMTDKLAAGQLNAQQASALFGEEGVRQVGKLRTVFGGLSDDLENMPAPVDDEDVENALEMERAINKLKATAQRAVGVFSQELVPIFADAAELFNKASDALPGGAEGEQVGAFYRQWLTGIGVVGTALDKLNDITGDNQITATFDETTIATSDLADATEDAKEAAFRHRLAVVDETSALEGQLGVIAATVQAHQEMADARRAAADSTFAVRDAQRDLDEQMAKWNELVGPDSEASMVDLATAMDETAIKAGALADAQVQLEEDSMASMGATQSAEEAQHTWNESMLDSARTTTGPMQAAIIDYIARINGIPPEKVSEILADPNYATIDEAADALDTAAADRDAEIRVEVDTRAAEAKISALARMIRNLQTIASVAAAGATATATVAGPTATVAGMSATPTATVAPVAVAPMVVRVPTPAVPAITFQVGVMGNRFDSQRAITKALRAHQRLNGQRP